MRYFLLLPLLGVMLLSACEKDDGLKNVAEPLHHCEAMRSFGATYEDGSLPIGCKKYLKD